MRIESESFHVKISLAVDCSLHPPRGEFGDPRYEPANLLLDDRYFDNLSGQQAYKCFACGVRRA